MRHPRWAFGTVLLLLLVRPAAPGESRASTRPPAAADIRTLTDKGEAVGPFEKLRVKDKYTVFDVYADWCGPCRMVDRYLRDLLATRKDIAVRRLNVVNFESRLARQLGPDFDALPYVVVFDPKGKRTEIVGFDEDELDQALGR